MDVFISRTGDTSRLPEQLHHGTVDGRVAIAGSLRQVTRAGFDLQRPIFGLPTNPVLILKTRKLILFFPTFASHLLLESFLTFAQLRWNLDDLILVIVGHGGVSLEGHFTSLNEESISYWFLRVLKCSKDTSEIILAFLSP